MAILIILAAIAALVIGYIFYGRWLAKQWGVDPTRKTPAVELSDGVDFVAAKPAVLMGHHFSSIAGAGPINGPIQAAVFGWLPVFLWCVLGGIFFGGLHDYGALFSSVRHGGKSIGDVIKDSMGKRAHKLFLIFALLVLILVIASFVNVVAGTFASEKWGITTGEVAGTETTAMVSMLFIVLAIVYGILTNKAGLKTVPATIIGVVCIIGFLFLGLNVGLAASRTFWIIFIGLYITIASLVPVWILLQPRDYLSSFLLYGMMGVAIIGIFLSTFTHSATFALPLVTGWKTAIGTMFPALFITVACGAISGFHSLVASGTTSKQLANEDHAKPIGYGAMLVESALAVISLIAVGMVSAKFIVTNDAGLYAFKGSPAVAFAEGIAIMFGGETTKVFGIIKALLTLAVSVFALTSLDTGTRLSRFMFSELFLKDDENTWRDAKGIRKVLTHPLFGTVTMVVIGCVLGGLSLSAIWGLFGAANQLLAGLALMAVAAWLGNIGKNRKMFIFPMIFMLCATLTSLVMKIISLFQGFSGSLAKLAEITSLEDLPAALEKIQAAFAWGNWFQLIFAIAMVILAIVLVIEGINTFVKQGKEKKNVQA